MKSFNHYFVKEQPEPQKPLRFVVYCASLKKDIDTSNSHTISNIVKQHLEDAGCEVEMFIANQLHFEPGVDLTDQAGKRDDLTTVLKTIEECDGLIVSTPIWWGVHSSYVQALFERMVYFDDLYIKSDKSVLYGKTFGGIISGADDGWQQIQGLMGSFATQLGFSLPPEAFVSSNEQSKSDILKSKELREIVQVFVRNQVQFAKMLKDTKFAQIQGNVNKSGETYT